MFKQKLNNLFFKQDKIISVLLVFLFVSFISRNTFFFGFIGNFGKVNSLFFGEDAPSLLQFIPFHSPSIILSSLLHPYFLLGFLFIYLPVIVWVKTFRQMKFEYTTTDKILVFAPAFLLTWEAVTFDYNYFLGSGFYFDRVILIVLAVLLMRFPLLTPAFIAFSLVYRSQYNYPIGGFELFDKNMLFDILTMFFVCHYIKVILKDPLVPFSWLVICIISANYFYCGMAKIMISPHGYEWVFRNNIADLFINCHLRGWLANLNENTIHAMWKFFDTFHVLFQVITIIVELSAIFILRNRKLAIIILLFSFILHIAIFFCSGALFWRWMAMDIVLLVLLAGKKMENVFSGKRYFIISVIVILTSVVWLKPLKIGWFDTPMNQYFTYEVEDEKGRVYPLEKNEMNPYHQWFQYDRFTWLVDKECLPITGFGTTGKYKVFEALKQTSPGELEELLLEYGVDYFRMKKTEKYTDFIRTYFHNKNLSAGKTRFFTYLKPPHLHNTSQGSEYKDQFPVKKFRVFYNLTFSSGGKSSHIERSLLSEVIID